MGRENVLRVQTPKGLGQWGQLPADSAGEERVR